MRSRGLAMAIAMLAAASIAAFACGESVREGRIVEKRHEERREWIQIVPIPHTVCTGQTCTTTFTYLPMLHIDDEDWILVLERCAEFECKRGDVNVSPEDWEIVAVGDWWARGGVEDRIVRQEAR